MASEMIASEAMIRQNRQSMKMATNCAEEFPMAVQLAGLRAHVDGGGRQAQRGPGRGADRQISAAR